MVDPKVPKTEDSAEKAYAAALEEVSAKPASEKPEATAEPEVSPPEAEAPEAVVVEPAPFEPEASAPEAVEEQPAPVELPAKAKLPGKAPALAPASAVTAKAAPAKPASRKAAPLRAKPAPKAAPVAKFKVAKQTVAKAKPAKPAVSNTVKNDTVPQLKDKIMATTTTKAPDFTKGFQDAIADMQLKAKAAFEKSTASLGEAGEFAKGNVEAFVESGKILAAGVQELGTTYVSESRSAFETLTADVKELASSKSPADFLKLQTELVRRNLDAAVAAGSKNSEAMLKLVNEAFAPISGRFSLAVDKIKKAA